MNVYGCVPRGSVHCEFVLHARLFLNLHTYFSLNSVDMSLLMTLEAEMKKEDAFGLQFALNLHVLSTCSDTYLEHNDTGIYVCIHERVK